MNNTFELRLFNWDKDTRILSAEVDNLRLDGMPPTITVFNKDTEQSRVFNYCCECTDGWAYENESHGLHMLIRNPRFQCHGEILGTQTPMVIYFDVSVPEGDKPTAEELDKHFARYYGTTSLTPTYAKNKRQHYKIGAYKD